MLFVDKLDQFGSYRLFYMSACEVVESRSPSTFYKTSALQGQRSMKHPMISIAYRGPPLSWSCYRRVATEKGWKWTDCCVCSDRTPENEVMAHHCCSTIVLSAAPSLASFPGPSREGGERAWYTLHMLWSP